MKRRREHDITDSVDDFFTISVDNKLIPATKGESVLSAMLASGIRVLMRNDYGEYSGACCGMGVCHCCLVNIDLKHKKRACQAVVKPGMRVLTKVNLVAEGDFHYGK
jgi:hydrogen cyanide synthase HcnA